MATVVQVEIVVSPTLTTPPPLLPYLKDGMELSVERVRVAGERNVTGGRVRQTGRPRRFNKPGYGPLAGSLTKHVFTAGPTDGASGFVRSNVFYGRFLEFGTQGHDIVARHRRANGRPGMLRFGPDSAPIFRRKVRAVGLGARHWMQDAAEGERPGVVTEFERAARRWADAFAAGTVAPDA